MRFWDSSALVPLLVEEAGSAAMEELMATDSEMAVWWGAQTECWSALARRERAEGLGGATMDKALSNLESIMESSHEILPSAALRSLSRRLLFTHPLSAADALQLAAALVLAGQDAGALEFVTLDSALARSARKEGLQVAGGE